MAPNIFKSTIRTFRTDSEVSNVLTKDLGSDYGELNPSHCDSVVGASVPSKTINAQLRETGKLARPPTTATPITAQPLTAPVASGSSIPPDERYSYPFYTGVDASKPFDTSIPLRNNIFQHVPPPQRGNFFRQPVVNSQFNFLNSQGYPTNPAVSDHLSSGKSINTVSISEPVKSVNSSSKFKANQSVYTSDDAQQIAQKESSWYDEVPYQSSTSGEWLLTNMNNLLGRYLK